MATGKLYKRGEKWYLSIHTGRKVNGKYERIQRKAQGRTKAEAQAEMDMLLFEHRQARRNGTALNNAYLLQSACNDWCGHIERTIADPEIVKEYCRHARRMVDALGLELVSEITLEAAEKAVASIAKKKSTSTANKSLAKLKAALEYAKDGGKIASNPLAKAKHVQLVRKKYRRALTEPEVKMLLKTAPEPWRTFWNFILSTGVRRGEFLHLRRADVDFEHARVRIPEREGFKPKTHAGARAIPLKPSLIALLKRLPVADSGLMFTHNNGKPLTTWALITFRRHVTAALIRLAKINKRWGQPLPENVTVKDNEFIVDTRPLDLHSMRYTFITELISKGVDPKTVQYLAGHKDIKTTLGIYAQYRGGNIDKATYILPW